MTETEPLRILLVEDEAMIAFLMESCLIASGHTVVGPAARVRAAMDLIDSKPVDLALLDVNIAGEEVYPVAVELQSRGIPFIFLSGYGARGLRGEWKNSPILQKPFEPNILEARIRAMMSGA